MYCVELYQDMSIPLNLFINMNKIKILLDKNVNLYLSQNFNKQDNTHNIISSESEGSSLK